MKMTGLFERIVHDLKDAVLVLDRDERVLFSNRAFEEMLGYRSQEILG